MKQKLGLLKDLKIGVLLGGISSERKISQKSGKAVFQAFERMGFAPVRLDPKYSKDFLNKLNLIDVAFIALHGRGGEDGQIQRVLEKRGIPYIGSDAQGARISFDKNLSKKIFAKKNIPTPPCCVLTEKNWKKQITKIDGDVFIKPPREGSSIGAFAVSNVKKASRKIESHLKKFGQLLAEKKITGREFTVGVLDSTPLPVIELKPKHGFYDYRCKYTKGMTNYEVPAQIPDHLRNKLQKIALNVHRGLGLRDFSRIDFMVDKQENAYALEANSIPGFTELSLLPKAAREAGISFDSLCLYLLAKACARSKNKRLIAISKLMQKENIPNA